MAQKQRDAYNYLVELPPGMVDARTQADLTVLDQAVTREAHNVAALADALKRAIEDTRINWSTTETLH